MQTGKRKKVNLRATHPALLILYFFSAIVFSMLTLNPAYLLISFIAALCLNFYLEGVGKTLRFLRYFVPVHLLLVLANALFSGNGLIRRRKTYPQSRIQPCDAAGLAALG